MSLNIRGFQKMTLLDFPGKVACIVFTGGCNFRCPFCHNASLVTGENSDDNISEDEVFSYLEKRKGLLDGVCITGGEPLLQPDIMKFIYNVKQLGYSVKLDTNGTSPDKLIALVEQGLVDYVAMDIKNSYEKYAMTAGVDNVKLSDINRSIDFLLSDVVEYEFRTTIVDELHDVKDITDICHRINGAKRYFLQGFVDSGNIIGDGMNAVSDEKAEKMRLVGAEILPIIKIRGK